MPDADAILFFTPSAEATGGGTHEREREGGRKDLLPPAVRKRPLWTIQQ